MTIQVLVFAISLLNILSKEGFTDILAVDSKLFNDLKTFGLTKNICLVSMFGFVHLNKCKFIGVSVVDSYQYFMVRYLPFALYFLVFFRADLSG